MVKPPFTETFNLARARQRLSEARSPEERNKLKREMYATLHSSGIQKIASLLKRAKP
jgi:hypothetical protein